VSPTKPTTAAEEESRAAAFQKFLNKMEKERPHEVLRLDDESILEGVKAISTGVISVDVALGCGGFPRGRVIELFGNEGGGKTSLALAVAANCQKNGGTVAFIDAEHTLTREHATWMGVDPHAMLIFQPTSGEDAIDMIDKVLAAKAADMIIVDSVAALVPTAELEAEASQQFMGLHARLMSKWMRRISSVVSETDTMMVLINQVRADLGKYMTPDVTTGGRAIKFYASVRIEVKTIVSKQIKNTAKEVIGQVCMVTIKKNKVGPPFKTAEYELIYGEGISSGGSLLDACVARGIITKSGSSYYDTTEDSGERLGVGKEKTKARIQSDPELTERLTAAVYRSLEHPEEFQVPFITPTSEDDDSDGDDD
jgi:recombination protein RecA